MPFLKFNFIEISPFCQLKETKKQNISFTELNSRFFSFLFLSIWCEKSWISKISVREMFVVVLG
jgi:hypothetical protein